MRKYLIQWFFCLIIGVTSARSLAAGAGLTLLGSIDQKHGTTSGISYSACWGYVAPDGREYAIVGTVTGTQIIDITNTDSLYEVAHIPGPTSIWREMRTYRTRAYIVTEGGGGVQIIDLSQLPASVTLLQSFNFSSGGKNILRNHTIEIFDGFMYLNGSANWSPGGTLIFSLANPDTPSFVGEYQPMYIHDSYVRNDTLFAAAVYGGGGLFIADVSNKTAPAQIAKISYAGSGTHNTWTTIDGRYAFTTDEIGSTPKTLKIWDLQSLPTPPTVPAATYAISPTDIVHNVFVRGKYAYIAWYTAGIVVVNVTDPTTPLLAGSYDTSTEPAGNYDGVWAVYPYFPSGKVIAGDMQNGLYIFSFGGLDPRKPIDLLTPLNGSQICTTEPLLFRWTAASDQIKDPVVYDLILSGPDLDTVISINGDTSHTYTDPLPDGSYAWTIATRDQITTLAAADTVGFLRAPLPSLDMTSPPGGDTVKGSSSIPVTWTGICIDSIEIALSTDNGASWSSIASSVPNAEGSYLWTVPLIEANNALLRIRDLADSTRFDVSDASFTIVISPNIQVIAPNGGEFWDAGTTQMVQWSSQAVDRVAIDVSTDGGFIWSPITTDTPAIPGSYPWNLPGIGAGNVFVRVRDTSDSTVVDQNDEAFVISAGPVHISEGWNLVSIPLLPVSRLATVNFPDASSKPFIHAGGYQPEDSVENGYGYWIKYDYSTSLNMEGSKVATDTIQLSERWNLIGSISEPLAVASLMTIPPTVSLSEFFRFSIDSGYTPVDSIRPGLGYWVKASEAGDLILDQAAYGTAQMVEGHPLNTSRRTVIVIRDATGAERLLALQSNDPSDIKFNPMPVPPLPPEGIFDARFSSGASSEANGELISSIRMTIRDAVYPLAISLLNDGAWELRYRISTETGYEKKPAGELDVDQPVILYSHTGDHLTLDLVHESSLPGTFSLQPNYPNPFNPSTVISFELPEAVHVTLKVYTLLGKEIATLVNGVQSAGRHSVDFSGEGLPSGVYIGKLMAGRHRGALKMILQK